MIPYNVLIKEDVIAARVDSLAGEIASSFADSPTILVGILRGSVVFLSDLMRAVFHHGMCPEVDFMILSSYEEGSKPGVLCVVQDVRLDLAGKSVLLVDDIADTGGTLAQARELLLAKGAARVATCVLLDKPSRRKVDFTPDFAGFKIDDLFVVGYGLDHANRYRCLPFIATVTAQGE